MLQKGSCSFLPAVLKASHKKCNPLLVNPCTQQAHAHKYIELQKVARPAERIIRVELNGRAVFLVMWW